MKNLIAFGLVTAFGVSVAACSSPPAPVVDEVIVSGGLQISPVGKVEDCTIYRFYDTGEYRYTTICSSGRPASVTSTNTRHCGKGCVVYVPDTVDTVVKEDNQ